MFNKTPAQKKFLIYLADNFQNQTLPHSEKARLLKAARALTHQLNSTFIQEVCRHLELPPKPEFLNIYLKIESLSPSLRKSLEQNRLQLHLLPKLILLPKSTQKLLGNLIQKFSLNLNYFTEIFSLLEELSLKNNLPISKIIIKLKLFSFLKLGIPPDARIKKLKETLMANRFPLLSKYEKKVRQIIKELAWPPSLKLKPPAFFEDEAWQVGLTFANIQELERHIKLLQKLVRQQEFQKILKELAA